MCEIQKKLFGFAFNSQGLLQKLNDNILGTMVSDRDDKSISPKILFCKWSIHDCLFSSLPSSRIMKTGILGEKIILISKYDSQFVLRAFHVEEELSGIDQIISSGIHPLK